MKTKDFMRLSSTLFVKKGKSGNIILQSKTYGNPRLTLKPSVVAILLSFLQKT
jgi:hypothetical protein